MRILLVHNYYRNPGGEETYLGMLKKLLTKRGNEVRLYTKNNSTINNTNFVGKISLILGMFWNARVYNEIEKITKTFRPDITHFNNIYPLITPSAYWACRKNSVPIVQTVHSLRFMFPNTYPQTLDKKILYGLAATWHKLIGSFNLPDKFIFPSKYVSDYYLGRSVVKKNASAIIPHYVEMQKYERIHKKDYFLFVGRLSKEKGIFDLLEAFKNSPRSKLIVIGDGPLEGKINIYEKCSNISLLGRVSHDKTIKYMASAKIVIVPSRIQEVLPMVVLEAYSCGSPVLVPNYGVFRQIVKGEVTGFFYKYASIRDLKNKIDLLTKKKITDKMRKNILKEGLKYSPKIHYSRILSLYKSLNKTGIEKSS